MSPHGTDCTYSYRRCITLRPVIALSMTYVSQLMLVMDRLGRRHRSLYISFLLILDVQGVQYRIVCFFNAKDSLRSLVVFTMPLGRGNKFTPSRLGPFP